MLGREEARLRGRVYPRTEKRIGLGDLVDYIAFSYLGSLGSRVAGLFELELELKRAGITEYPALYAAKVLLYTIVSAIVSLYLALWVAISGLGVIAKVSLVITLLLAPVAVFSYGMLKPSLQASSRRQRTESEMPFFAAYLSTLARAGVPVEVVIERLSGLRVFRAIRREAQLILRNVRFLGMDPLDAIEENALYHPSPRYREFMLGYVTTVRTGGDVVHYLEVRTQEIFNQRLTDLRLAGERMALYMESFILFAVVGTITLYIFFVISSLVPAGIGGTAYFAVYSFLVLPLADLFMILLVDRTQPKTPVRILTPYRALLLYGIPLSLATASILVLVTDLYRLPLQYQGITKDLILRLNIVLAALLVSVALPPAFVYTYEKLSTKGYSAAITDFLRDLSDARKTGLSPEKSIESLSQRDYGALSRVVRRIGVSLRLGLNLEEAVRNAIAGVKDWVVIVSFRFLVDSIELGGGSPQILESLARYSRGIADLEEEMGRRLRIHAFAPYLGALLIAGAGLIVLKYLSGSLAPADIGEELRIGVLAITGISREAVAQIALISSLGALIHSWLMGLIAGKIRDGTVAAGFLHSVILTLVTLIVVLLLVRTLDIP